MPSKIKNKRVWSLEGQRYLKNLCRCALETPELRKKGPKARVWEVYLSFVGEKKMASTNSKFRKMKKPTDVLSFSAPESFWKLGLLGEIVICLPMLRKQAAWYGHLPETELKVLLTHGFLHLLGYDHEKNHASARQMLQWELTLLKEVFRMNHAPCLIGRNGLHLPGQSR